jgi:hypothetical protein
MCDPHKAGKPQVKTMGWSNPMNVPITAAIVIESDLGKLQIIM